MRRGVGWLRTHVKRYAWRTTAAYFWLAALGGIFGFYGTLSYLQQLLFGGLLASLARIGFEPVNVSYLGIVFGVLWVLTITVFRPRELLGLFFYTLLFLFWAPVICVLFALKLFSKKVDTLPEVRQPHSTTEQPVRLLAICTVLLAAWVVLYGGATDWRQVLPGIILSGAVLWLLMLRLFYRVRPTTESRLVQFGWLTRFTETVMVEHYSNDLDPNDYDVSKLDSEIKIIRFYRKCLLRLARMGRSPRWRNRLTMLILAEYIVSLIVVTMAAIFFWALIISVAGTESLPLSEALRRSAEYFFPTAGASSTGIELPFWAMVGPAATSFLLFVLYIGLASSLVRERQRLALQGLANASRVMRDHAAALRTATSTRYQIKESLSQKELPEGE